MKLLIKALSILFISSSLFSCGKPNQQNDGKITNNLRALKQIERAADYEQFIELFKVYYGPYNYKKQVMNIDIDAKANELRDLAVNATTEEEFAGVLMQFGAALKDRHVQISIRNTNSGISRYVVPIYLIPIENKVLIEDIAEGLANQLNLSIGDEILEVDGKEPMAYLPTITKYDGWATKTSEKHAIIRLFLRPSYMTDLIPTKSTVTVKIKKADDDSILTKEITWEARKYNDDLGKMFNPKNKTFIDRRASLANEINSIIAGRIKMGNDDPFFVTPQTIKKYNLLKVYPTDAARKKAGLKDDEKPPIYAALYKHMGKTILLARIAHYSPEDFTSAVYLKTYKALFTEYQDLADVLVVDQTHNPGGSYCDQFYELFSKESDVQAVQQCNADRKWINGLSVLWPNSIINEEGLTWIARQYQAAGAIVEKAYDAGLRLSEPIALFTGQPYADSSASVWKKPMIVLVDELAGSCGDVFPMLVKANKRAKLFGQQTMGLGGNVENVGTLNNSNVSVSMTRGLFTSFKPNGNYRDADMIENNGVVPDIEYNHTVKDFRAGYTSYIKAFSDAAIAAIDEKADTATSK